MKRNIGKGKIHAGWAVLPVLAAFAAVCLWLDVSPDRMIGAAFCHQIPDRSPAYGFPFCYRCCGMFSGLCFGVFPYISGKGKTGNLLSKKRLLFFAGTFILFFIDAVNSASFLPINWYRESPLSRFLTAWPFGFSIAAFILPVFTQFFGPVNDRPAYSWAGKILWFFCGLGLSALMVFSGNRLFSALLRILLCTGTVSLVSILFAVLIQCFAILRNRSFRRTTACLAGFIMAVVQITLIGGVHLYLVQSGLFVL